MTRQTQRPRSQIRLMVLTGLALLALLLAAGLAAAAPDSPTRMSLAQKSTPTPAAPPPEATAETGTVSGGVFGGLPLGNNGDGVSLGSGDSTDQTGGQSTDSGTTGSNSSGSEATIPVLSYGETASGTLDDTTYITLYAFEASAGDSVTVHMEATGNGGLDPYLGLLDGDQNILIEDDDSGGDTNAEFTFNLPASATYYIVATRYGIDEGTTSGAYLLSLDLAGQGTTDTSGASGDVQVMGAGIDEPWNVSPLIAPGMVVGNIVDDTNWGWAYAIDAQAGTTITVRMEAVDGSALDCYLGLVDSDENVVAEDDDSGGGTNSQIVFTVPQTGRYYIFATRYNTSDGESGGAFILGYVESDASGGQTGTSSSTGATGATGSATLDYNLTPTFGGVELVSGFQDDPFTVSITAGGSVDTSTELGSPCLGFVASAPDFRLLYTAGQYNLRMFFTGESDTTLVVNAPDGSWYCDDDSGGNLHPLLNFIDPLDGQYDIWVGSYEADQFVPGELTITEMDIMPESSTGKAAFSLSDNWK